MPVGCGCPTVSCRPAELFSPALTGCRCRGLNVPGNGTRSRWAPAWLSWGGFGIGERGIYVKRVMFRSKVMFRFRAASGCIPHVPVLSNKGVTKQENYDSIFFPPL